MMSSPEQTSRSPDPKLNVKVPASLKRILSRISSLWTSTEGRMLLTGLSLALVSVAALFGMSLVSTGNSQMLVGMTATHILFGRAAGMSFGYALGVGHAVVIPVNMLIETVLVLVLYPLFVLGWERMVVIPSLGKFMQRTREAAETHQDTIRRYGPVGLLVFVFIPFWMTGPLVGCVIGHLVGLRPWLNLGIVLSATYVAIGAWAVLLHEIHTRVAEFSPYAPMILVAMLVIAIVGGQVLHEARRQNGKR